MNESINASLINKSIHSSKQQPVDKTKPCPTWFSFSIIYILIQYGRTNHYLCFIATLTIFSSNASLYCDK